MNRQLDKLALALMLGASLAACNGGGGGDDGSAGGQKTTSSVVLTDANKEQVAHNAVGAVDKATTVTSSGAGLLGGVQVAGQQQKVQWPLLLARKGLDLLAAIPPGSGLVGGAAINNTQQCPGGGTIDFSINDADNSNAASKGDSVSAHFNNCSETAEGITTLMNGGFTLVLGDMTGAIGQANSSFNLTMNMQAPGLMVGVTQNGKLVTTTITGDMSMGLQLATSGATVTTSSSNLAATTSDGETLGYSNFRMTANDSPTRVSFSIDGDIAASNKDFAGAYTLSMTNPTTPLVYTNKRNYPDSGELRVKGANGTLTLTVQPNAQVLISLNAGGKTSSRTVSWCSINDC